MAQVLAPSPPPDTQLRSSPSGLLQSSSPRSSLASLPFSASSRIPSPAIPLSQEDDSSSSYSQSSATTSESSSPVYSDPRTASSKAPTPTHLSLDTTASLANDDSDHLLPFYDQPISSRPAASSVPPVSPSSDHIGSETTTDTTPSEEPLSPEILHVADDSEARIEPSRQVDYLSHDWREEDIWSSWKHIVSQRKVYGERSRLENASWRSWAKQRNHLKTVAPEKLNWLKDCDVTWLYGPLQPYKPQNNIGSEPVSQLSKTNSFINKKPILKKRSASEVMLQKSISTSSLVKQAAAAVQAQRKTYSFSADRPALGHTRSDFGANSVITTADLSNAFPSASSSGIQSPEAGHGRRHIRFDNTVEQRIAVDFKDTPNDDDDEDENAPWDALYSDTSSEDELPMMKATQRRPSSNAPSSRNSFSSGEQKGIAMLPSTTLKFDSDSDTRNLPPTPGIGASLYRTDSIQSNDSQETLRPSNSSTNFLIEHDSDDEANWHPSGAFSRTRQESSTSQREHRLQPKRVDYGDEDDEYDDGDTGSRMRRTNSGMFMPYEPDEEEEIMNSGLFGRIVDTVNTARDIAHVVWNVGWRK